MQTLMFYGAMISAFIAALCAFVVVVDLLQNVYMEDTANVHDEIFKRYYKRLPLLIRLSMPMTPMFMRAAQSNLFAGQTKKIASLLIQAGFGQIIPPLTFVAARLGATFIGFLFAVLLLLMKHPAYAVIILILFYYSPYAWLVATRNKRHLQIQKALPNVLDLLTLSTEAGKDFISALRDILRRRSSDALGEELQRTFQEIQLGKSRREALRELSLRVQQPDLTSVMNALIQADELGVSIGQVLRIQGDQLRMKRFQRADKLANEAPTKIIMPLMICIFPAIFIILLVPFVYQYFFKGGGI